MGSVALSGVNSRSTIWNGRRTISPPSRPEFSHVLLHTSSAWRTCRTAALPSRTGPDGRASGRGTRQYSTAILNATVASRRTLYPLPGFCRDAQTKREIRKHDQHELSGAEKSFRLVHDAEVS